jgi:HTH-type transcriptional regulator/antitoxin MqsA
MAALSSCSSSRSEVLFVERHVICSICGGPATLFEEPQTMNMGGRTVTYLDQFYRCAQCGETLYLGEMAGESFRRAAATIRAEDGLLTPDEIVGLRKKYGLTQAQLERLIGAGEKTVVRWERGSVAQNKTADTLLRVLLEHPDVVVALKRQNGLVKPARRRSSATAAPKRKNAADART